MELLPNLNPLGLFPGRHITQVAGCEQGLEARGVHFRVGLAVAEVVRPWADGFVALGRRGTGVDEYPAEGMVAARADDVVAGRAFVLAQAQLWPLPGKAVVAFGVADIRARDVVQALHAVPEAVAPSVVQHGVGVEIGSSFPGPLLVEEDLGFARQFGHEFNALGRILGPDGAVVFELAVGGPDAVPVEKGRELGLHGDLSLGGCAD